MLLKDTTIGYLRQEIMPTSDLCLLEDVTHASTRINGVARRIQVLHSELAEETDSDNSRMLDLVADLRAATPSAAAETAVPVRAEVEADVARNARRLRSALSLRAERARGDVARSARELTIRARRVVEMRRAWIAAVAASLEALSPLRTLERGYAVARAADGTTLGSVRQFATGADFALVVRDGEVRARTLSTHAESP